MQEDLSKAGGRARFGWAMFDWANQPYFTLVITFIFAPYFTAHVVGDPVRGQELWGHGQAIAGLIIALMSPVLGAIADVGGRRKPWIYFFQAILIVTSASLWLATPGADAGQIVMILSLIVISSIAAEFSVVFNNAMLPSLAQPGRLGRLSGFGWTMGYVGGLISLFLVLFGFVLPESPILPIDKLAHEQDRLVGPLSALWIILFLLPFILFTPDRPASHMGMFRAVHQGLGELWMTLKAVRHYGNLWRFLIARMIYQDGLSAVFAFGGIYAVGIFGWDTTGLGMFGIILIICAGIGAYAGGWLDDHLGSKRTIQFSLWGLLIGTAGVVSIATMPVADGVRAETILFVITEEVTFDAAGGILQTRAEWVFLMFGILIGICGGPVQAASRAMLSRLAPEEEVGRFYGLYAMTGKATAFLAPFTVAMLTGFYDSQRAGIASIMVFFVIGFLLFLGVKQQRARSIAHLSE